MPRPVAATVDHTDQIRRDAEAEVPVRSIPGDGVERSVLCVLVVDRQSVPAVAVGHVRDDRTGAVVETDTGPDVVVGDVAQRRPVRSDPGDADAVVVVGDVAVDRRAAEEQPDSRVVPDRAIPLDLDIAGEGVATGDADTRQIGEGIARDAAEGRAKDDDAVDGCR